jgi:uncharacterized protein (DUF2235 family)
MKRLALFMDGTWNDEADRTNVLRLFELSASHGAGGAQQRAKYIPGVGTKWHERITGGAVGRGLSDNVLEAYRWLHKHYDWESPEPDQIFLFGFSRGAYTARSVAGLIATCGLMRPGAPFDVQWLYQRYRDRKQQAEPIYRLEYFRQSGERKLTPDEERLLEHSRRVDIHMIGVWDTVGALGIPWTGMPLIGKRAFYFHNPNLSVINKHAFQALAIDEHRQPYKPTLWTVFQPKAKSGSPAIPGLERCEQRWFAGAHSNVGGGYQNDTFPEEPLAWMQSKAASLGLGFSSQVVPSAGAYSIKPVDSYAKFMGGAYRLATFGARYYRPIGIEKNPVKGGWSYPVNEWIDGSVFERCRRDPEYRPPNLLEWQRRRGLPAVEQIVGEQRA